jgi:hypothetical protein
MTKLRRSDRDAPPFSVTAEVLEVRSLLSAGAHAAAAAAIQAQHHDVPTAASPPPIILTGSQFADFIECAELGIANFHVDGRFQKASVAAIVGGKVHASWTQTGEFDGLGFTITSIKCSISTVVTKIETSPTQTKFDFTPAGSLTLKGTFNGHSFTTKLKADPAEPAALYLHPSTNAFFALAEDFRLPNKGPTHGGLLAVTLEPPA